MKPYLCLIALLLLSSSFSYAEDFESGFWPGEGRPVFIAANNALTLYSRPEKTAVVVQMPYHKGWLVPFDKTLVRTLQSDFLIVKNATTLNIWCGRPRSKPEQIDFNVGDEIEVLQYRAEGYYIVQIENRICTMPIYPGNELFGGLPNPKVEWWSRVVYADGTSPGWLLVDDQQISFGRRQF